MANRSISQSDLEWAVQEGLLSPEQASALWDALAERRSVSSPFDLAHTSYYAGALIVISAMAWFMTEAFDSFSGVGLTAVALGYAIVFSAVGHNLWFRRNLEVPGGLLFTVAVCMTPLAIYGLERATGIWPQGDPGRYSGFYVWVKGSWLLMEVGTVLAGVLVLQWIRFPFLTAPIAFALWYLSMDLTPFLMGQDDFSWEQRRIVSLWFGLAMLTATYLIDRRTREDYAFWGYLFGLLAFWGGLSLSESDSELAKFGYLLVNLFLMILSVLLQRRAFIVFGGIGVFIYLGHLSQVVFKDSLLFPFALSLVGVLVIYAGVKFERHQARIEEFLTGIIPKSARHLLPHERE
jgi:hypothetical protein